LSENGDLNCEVVDVTITTKKTITTFRIPTRGRLSPPNARSGRVTAWNPPGLHGDALFRVSDAFVVIASVAPHA
jgi:hypothetical protein